MSKVHAIGVLVLAALAVAMAWPHMWQRTYTEAILSGKCSKTPDLKECHPPAEAAVPGG
jgi:hypothetical protein